MKFSSLFKVFAAESDSSQETYFVSLNDFVSFLKSKDLQKKIIVSNVKRALQSYSGGIQTVNGEQSIPVKSLLRYCFHYAESLDGCDFISNIVEREILCQKEIENVSSSFDLYKLIAKTQFRNTEFPSQGAVYDEQVIETLVVEHKSHFTQEEWHKICWFENHFHKSESSLPHEYEKLLALKYSKFQSILSFRDSCERLLKITNNDVKVKAKRITCAEDIGRVEITAAKCHFPYILDSDILDLLQHYCNENIIAVISFDTLNSKKNNTIQVVIQVSTQDLNYDVSELCRRAYHHVLQKHNVHIECVYFCSEENLKDFLTGQNPARFQLRDLIETNSFEGILIKWLNEENFGENTSDITDSSPCESCSLSSATIRPLELKNLNIFHEWFIETPIEVQLLLETFINRRSLKKAFKKDSTGLAFLANKLEKLVRLYDSLLNIYNRNFIGIFQENDVQNDKRPVDMGLNYLCHHTHSILQDYTVYWNQKLGTGISGPVRPCMKKDGGGMFALKCLHDSPKSQTEVNLHMMCSKHPNIVKVLDVYANDLQFPGDKQAKPYLLMVLEMMEGGELFDRISKEKRFTERKAARYFKKIAEAVRHCHSLNVAHRDLKPENILLSDNSQEAEVKLSDFGFAKIDDGNLQTPYFTPYYVAPQILEAHRHQSRLKRGIIQTSKPYTYDKSCDMWSLGVILYIMLCGYPPFYSETPSRQITMEMRRKILSGEFEFPEDEWCHVSNEAKELVRSLLHVDPSYRINVDDLMEFPWLEEAPDNRLHSPAIISDKQSLEDINLAHSQQLTVMRTPECQLTLKPIIESQNPMLRKRKYRDSERETSARQDSIREPSEKLATFEMGIKSLRNIIAYCILPPKVDDDESVLNGLVSKAADLHNSSKNGFTNILNTWVWDGEKFNAKVDKSKLAQMLSELVQGLTKEPFKRSSSMEVE